MCGALWRGCSHSGPHMGNGPGRLKLHILPEERRVVCPGRRGKGSGEVGLARAPGSVRRGLTVKCGAGASSQSPDFTPRS